MTTVTNLFKAPMLQCPERIWPNYNWSKLQVVFVYPSSDTSWLWSGSDQSIKDVRNDQLPSAALESGYEFFELNNLSSVSIDMENEDEPFQLAVHEFFHDQGQKNEVDPAGLRGTDYPIQPEPRIFRAMLKQRLYEALQESSREKRTDSLKKAAYWYQKWKSEYPEEFNSSTDGYEGTATYVEYMAVAIADKGCDAPIDIILSTASQELIKSEADTPTTLMLDGEGYEIGAAASLLLRANSQIDWFSQISLGMPPTEILLGSLNAKKDKAPEATIKRFTDESNMVNEKLYLQIGQDIELLDNHEYVRVAIPMNNLQTNLMPTGFYKTAKIPNGMIFNLAFEHIFSDSSLQMSASPGKIMMILPDEIAGCNSSEENPMLYTLVKKSDIKTDGPILTVHSKGIKGSLRGQITVDKNGLSYFCSM